MGKPKRLKVAVLTFTAALGSGLIMQYGDAVASRWGMDQPISGPETRAAAQAVPLVPVSAIAAAPQLRSAPNMMRPRAQRVSLTDTQSDEPVPSLDLQVSFETPPAELDVASASLGTEGLGTDITADITTDITAPEVPALETSPVETANCEIGFEAASAPLAHVALKLTAPCHAETPIVIHHQGMMFHAITDADGSLAVDVPALSEEAFFIAAFDDGEGAVAITGVPELAQYDRAVLQWQGDTGVQLHARENGATYGTEGHVWAEASGDLQSVTDGNGGLLTPLGNPNVPEALQAEIYTFPSGKASTDGDVLLTVEAEVTSTNCGRDVSAQSIQIAPDAEPTAIDLTLTMPACDSIGEFLVLNNMFEDLTLAAK